MNASRPWRVQSSRLSCVDWVEDHLRPAAIRGFAGCWPDVSPFASVAVRQLSAWAVSKARQPTRSPHLRTLAPLFPRSKLKLPRPMDQCVFVRRKGFVCEVELDAYLALSQFSGFPKPRLPTASADPKEAVRQLSPAGDEPRLEAMSTPSVG